MSTEDTITELHADLAKLTQENERLRSRSVTELAADHSNLAEYIEQMEKELTALRSEVAHLTASRDAEHEAHRMTQCERDALKAEHDEHVQFVAALVQRRSREDITRGAEVEHLKEINRRACIEWAETDTAIKAICKKHGIADEHPAGVNAFKTMEECVEELGGQVAALGSELAKVREVLSYARPYVKNASVRMYDGTNGEHLRKEAEYRLELIDALLAARASNPEQ